MTLQRLLIMMKLGSCCRLSRVRSLKGARETGGGEGGAAAGATEGAGSDKVKCPQAAHSGSYRQICTGSRVAIITIIIIIKIS
jgi:hypothetical protein